MKELVRVVNRSGGILFPDDNDMFKALITIRNYCKMRHEVPDGIVKPCSNCFLSLEIDKGPTKKRAVYCTFGKKPMHWKVNSMFKRNFVKLICSRLEGKEHEDRDSIKE